MKKILVISSWFPTDNDPVNGSFVYEQAAALQKAGHTVSVLMPNLSGSARQTLSTGGLKPGQRTRVYKKIPVYEIVQPVYLPMHKQYYTKRLYKKCFRFLETYINENGRPDILHSHAAFMGGVIASQLSAGFNIPLVHTEHTSGLIFNPGQYTRADRKAFARLAERAAAFLFVSRFAREKIMQTTAAHWQAPAVLPNMVDNSFFVPQPAPEGPFTVLCIGRYTPVKNHALLLAAWKIFSARHPGARLLLAGKDLDSAGFLTLLQDSGVSPSVSCMPALERAAVYEQIVRAHVLVSSSETETFGLSLAEALACGRPVLATDSGGPADIITPGDGFLVPRNDAGAFAEALEKIYQGQYDPPEVLSERCRARFGEARIVQALEAIYAGL